MTLRDATFCSSTIETDACSPMNRRIETGSLHPNPIYPKQFPRVRFEYFGLPNTSLLVSLHFKTRKLWNVLFSGIIIVWALMTYGTFYCVTFHSVMYHRGMSWAISPYVAASWFPINPNQTTLLAVLSVYLSSDAYRGCLFHRVHIFTRDETGSVYQPQVGSYALSPLFCTG